MYDLLLSSGMELYLLLEITFYLTPHLTELIYSFELGMSSFLGWDTSQRLLLFRLAATGQSYMTRKLSMPTKCISEICAQNA